MKKGSIYHPLLHLAFIAVVLITSCKSSTTQLSAAENASVKDSVTRMAANISHDLSATGPAAWVNYFENDPGFFMASGGSLVFRDYATAKMYTLDTVAKNLKKI